MTQLAQKFIVLDPTLDVEATQVAQAPRPVHISTLGLLDNGKRNSDKLLRMVTDKMLAEHPDVKINYYRKLGAYRPAPAALLDQVVAENDAVLVGIGY